MKKIILGLSVFVAALLLSAVIVWIRTPSTQPLLSPITAKTVFRFLTNESFPSQTGRKMVYGFLPYWNVNTVSIQPELTHLAYFSLAIGPDGDILTVTKGQPDQGFNKFKSDELLTLMTSIKKRNGKVELVFSQLNNDDITAFVLNENAHQKFLESLDSALLAYPVDGVNLDIEYLGDVTPQLRNRFSDLMTQIHNHLQQKYTSIPLSVDIYSTSGNNAGLWDLEKIAPVTDRFIIMAYDFHRRSSIMAGPVAPLFGGRKFWDHDITLDIRQILTYVPSNKIILGVPFYGYEWQTTSDDAQARTYPDTGETATVDKIQTLLTKKDQLGIEEHWNEDALSPYLSFQKNNQTFVLYYENSRSLSYKLDLVNQLDLGGIAIWALGYEKSDRELWDVIKLKL